MWGSFIQTIIDFLIIALALFIVMRTFNHVVAKAKEQGTKSWDDAHLSPAERSAKMQEEREAQIAAAKARTAEANARYEEAKKK